MTTRRALGRQHWWWPFYYFPCIAAAKLNTLGIAIVIHSENDQNTWRWMSSCLTQSFVLKSIIHDPVNNKKHILYSSCESTFLSEMEPFYPWYYFDKLKKHPAL